MFKGEEYGTFMELITNSIKESIDQRYLTIRDSLQESRVTLNESKENSKQDRPEALKNEEKKLVDYEAEINAMKRKVVETEALALDFRQENIIQAMIYTEVLGKPKAKSRRRW